MSVTVGVSTLVSTLVRLLHIASIMLELDDGKKRDDRVTHIHGHRILNEEDKERWDTAATYIAVVLNHVTMQEMVSNGYTRAEVVQLFELIGEPEGWDDGGAGMLYCSWWGLVEGVAKVVDVLRGKTVEDPEGKGAIPDELVTSTIHKENQAERLVRERLHEGWFHVWLL